MGYLIISKQLDYF